MSQLRNERQRASYYIHENFLLLVVYIENPGILSIIKVLQYDMIWFNGRFQGIQSFDRLQRSIHELYSRHEFIPPNTRHSCEQISNDFARQLYLTTDRLGEEKEEEPKWWRKCTA